MLALAALPSSSVALVVWRSSRFGTGNGVAAAVGVALGDVLFVGLACAGMSVLSVWMGSLFGILRYAAAAYLIWVGIGLLRDAGKVPEVGHVPASGRWAFSLLAGLGLTLGDVKAIAFYAALFPAFLDVAVLRGPDMLLIAALTFMAIFSVKCCYAFAARAIIRRWPGRLSAAPVKMVAGAGCVAAGGYMICRP
nr:LysE family translocator [Altericroceibacterium endophyticum]